MNKHKVLDGIFKNSTLFFAFFVLLLLASIIGSLFWGSKPSFDKFGWNFLSSKEWNLIDSNYGALNAIWGTIVTSIIALVIAVPVSFGVAIFLTELCPRFLKRPLGIAIDLLAGIPSIIYGMWGFFVFVPWFMQYQPAMMEFCAQIPVLNQFIAGYPIGIGIFTAGFILSLMILPFIAATMRDVFEVVPPMLKESAYGLGSTTWEVLWNVVIPFTKSGIVGGIMLGLGRALGETMAVTFVIGNSHTISNMLFAPGTTISAVLALEFAEATDPFHSSAMLMLGLILFGVTFIVLSMSKLMLLRLKSMEGTKT
jgi:phosphate transport system permease protein